MRRILVDSARRHGQLKRAGDQERVEWHETRIAAPVEDDKLLLVNEALDALAREDPLKAEVVKLRYFVGLKHQEIADALGVSEPTIRRHSAPSNRRAGLRPTSWSYGQESPGRKGSHASRVRKLAKARES
jgi:DNA-directed RNA polymerase specialized sigma24 family protein